MINLIDFQQKMKILFQKKDQTENDLGLRIEHHTFSTHIKIKQIEPGIMKGDLFYHELIDTDAPENFKFTYPIVIPQGTKKYKSGLLLLHGLNEKSWDKYLAWAGQLALKKQCPVILFPIAYHMNRAPKHWSNPRLMQDIVKKRLNKGKKNETTFANAALSTRLDSNPEQFIYSGIQSYYDIWQLLSHINSGKHTLFEHNTKLDFFAYSIGAFLSQIIFISNPDKLLSTSRLFLFAGGTTFDKMIGKSKFIIDLNAFDSLLSLRHKKILHKTYNTLQKANFQNFENIWHGFLSMLSQKGGYKTREEVFNERGSQIYALALEKDKVMPVKYVLKTLKGKKNNFPPRVDVIDFPYKYSHENPFPLKDKENMAFVNRSFSIVIEKAIRFYNQSSNAKENEFAPKPQLSAQSG